MSRAPPAASSRWVSSSTTKGEKLTAGFAPNFVSSVAPEPFETLTYVEGRPPESADEASIDTSTAENEKLADRRHAAHRGRA